MWTKVGVVRTEEGLREALTGLEGIQEAAEDLRVRPGRTFNTEVFEALELRMMLATARAMAHSALERRESRGSHLRLDYPQRDDAHWLKNIMVRKEGDMLRLRSEKVPPQEDQP